MNCHVKVNENIEEAQIKLCLYPEKGVYNHFTLLMNCNFRWNLCEQQKLELCLSVRV